MHERSILASGTDAADGDELDELRVEAAELRASLRRVARAADAERRGLERALHDGVQQQLIGLAADLELAVASIDTDPTTTRELLEAVRRDVALTIEAARELAHYVYPPLLDAGGLRTTLRAVATTRSVPLRIEVLVGRTCPVDVAAVAYFCCLDVLERVEPGTSVAISIREGTDALDVEIVTEQALELTTSLRDRVSAAGGRLGSEREPHGANRLTGSLPYA
jgi:signal transduction histidine kinase